MENILLSNFIKTIRLKTKLREIVYYVCNHPNTKVLDVSIADNFSVGRLGFTMLSPRNNSMTIATIEDIARVAVYDEYLKLIQKIGNLISKTLNTVRYPLNVIGFSFDRDTIKQLKVYYMLRIFDEEAVKKECIMGKIDQSLSQKAIKKVLKELAYNEQSAKVENIFQIMSSENLELEFIGINIEKKKSPSLKLYFRPKQDEEKIE